MPYQAQADTSVPRVIARGEDAEGNEYVETESVVRVRGEVIDDSEIAPDVLERLENGDDDRLSGLLKQVSESEAKKIREEQGLEGVAVAPEHEAEAEVLAESGKDVLTHEEVVESNPNGDVPAEEEEEDDPSEGREAREEDDPRIHEVDEKRRGDAPAPEPRPAAKESKSRSKAKAKDSGSEEGQGDKS